MYVFVLFLRFLLRIFKTNCCRRKNRTRLTLCKGKSIIRMEMKSVERITRRHISTLPLKNLKRDFRKTSNLGVFKVLIMREFIKKHLILESYFLILELLLLYLRCKNLTCLVIFFVQDSWILFDIIPSPWRNFRSPLPLPEGLLKLTIIVFLMKQKIWLTWQLTVYFQFSSMKVTPLALLKNFF